jgi:hypothetical protein
MKASSMGTSILRRVTTKSQAPRRAALVVGSATLLLLGYAGPASADIPVGWSHPAPVDALRQIAIFFGIPLLITLTILAFLYLPPVIRGESVAPAGSRPDDQWFGGRRDVAELEPANAAGEIETERDTGGAGGTW